MKVALACCLMFTGCAVTPGLEIDPLPFHVAIVPPLVHEQEVEGDAGKSTARIHIDPREVVDRLAEELETRCFARVTLLEEPEGPEDDTWWIDQASRVSADLILECEIAIDPRLEVERNDRFWLNLPLILLGGPLCYFVDDVSYRCAAFLDGSFHDLGPLLRREFDLARGGARVTDVRSRFEETSLDLVDRVDFRPGIYALSLVVPPGYLATTSEDALRVVSDRVVEQLVDGFTHDVCVQADQFGVVDRLWDHYLDGSSTATRGADGSIRVQGRILSRSGDVARLEGFRVRAGDVVLSRPHEFLDREASRAPDDGRLMQTRVDVSIAATANTEFVRLEILEGGFAPRTRTFTLRVVSDPSIRDEVKELDRRTAARPAIDGSSG